MEINKKKILVQNAIREGKSQLIKNSISASALKRREGFSFATCCSRFYRDYYSRPEAKLKVFLLSRTFFFLSAGNVCNYRKKQLIKGDAKLGCC